MLDESMFVVGLVNLFFILYVMFQNTLAIVETKNVSRFLVFTFIAVLLFFQNGLILMNDFLSPAWNWLDIIFGFFLIIIIVRALGER